MKTMLRLLIIIIACQSILCSAGNQGGPMGKPEQPPVIITAEEAQKRAYEGFKQNSFAFSPNIVEAMTQTRASTPLLVQRTDQVDTYYYIVPFVRDNKTALVILLDAKNGEFKEASFPPNPIAYPPINEAKAIQILLDYLKKNHPAQTPAQVKKPVLIWEPCHQTQSPYEPLWKFEVAGSFWYIDQTGQVADKIIPVKLKGG